MLPWASPERLGALLNGGGRHLLLQVATAVESPRSPSQKSGRTRGQFVLDGSAASTVVVTGTRRGLDCSGFLTWTSSVPLA